MKIKIISWNIRGANDRDKRKVIKALIRSQRADLVCLQETKIQDISRGIVHSLGVGRFLGWGAMSARGAAGGVVVFWDKRVLELMGMEVGLFSVSCRFKNCEDGFLWTFTGVYGPTIKRHRELFWEELGAMHSEFEMRMMGELNFFFGLQIKQLKEGNFINQAKYIRDLLKRFNMEEAKTMKTPMSSSIKLDKYEKGKSINSTMYRGMIGSLLYLTASRPNIMYKCLCARFQSCPKESHLI